VDGGIGVIRLPRLACIEAPTQDEGVRRQVHLNLFRSNGAGTAASFVEVWRRLPRWRRAARLASLQGALAILELGYRLFLRARPFISRSVARLQ